MSHPAPPKTAAPKTVADVLGAFTLDRVMATADVGLRDTLTRSHQMISGIVAIILAADGDEKKLAAVSITLEDAEGLVADTLHLLDEIADRNAKQAAANAAVIAVNATDREINEHLSTVALLLRGQFGPKSPILKKFGVTPLSTGGRKKTAAAATPPAAGTAPAAAKGV